ncbi:hypothetical protein OAP25_02100 [Flavobacteriaceae bacterium]|nr:hypothetical protein [Flavobacteriaceae bacterium]
MDNLEREELLNNHQAYLEGMILCVQDMNETHFTTGALAGYEAALDAFKSLRKQLDIIKGE